MLLCDRNAPTCTGNTMGGVTKPAHHCQVVFHLLVLQEVWIRLLSYETPHESLLFTAIFAPSSLVARAPTHCFLLLYKKLQPKCIWLLKITHSPKTLGLAPPCSHQKGDILTHTTSIQTHCRPLTPNKQPTPPSNIFVLLHRIIFLQWKLKLLPRKRQFHRHHLLDHLTLDT